MFLVETGEGGTIPYTKYQCLVDGAGVSAVGRVGRTRGVPLPLSEDYHLPQRPCWLSRVTPEWVPQLGGQYQVRAGSASLLAVDTNNLQQWSAYTERMHQSLQGDSSTP